MEQPTTFESWAVLELFGHKKVAGYVTETTIGGASFIRIDVPKANGETSHTKFLGAAAIYSINPVSKEVAIAAAQYHYDPPVSKYELPMLTSPATAEAEEEDGEELEDHRKYLGRLIINVEQRIRQQKRRDKIALLKASGQ